ncbi:tripartite ATP-independent periplasmic transporter DctQ component [Candidatus Vecturithrix granuli]|uniref:Tripartite ATP-independent periplasmic transporter DctQ component n=1 Tax=Vecturithrix granuli TaxID=1499967 RepID=A0A081C8D8_VECG1|nr:tripartite ATP-independent periplasmic transporter DctQ component [Candidatus Vecturithrix granuli]
MNKITQYVCVGLIGVVVVLVLVTIFFRYVLSIGINWSDELARYLNIWVALLGASVAYKSGDHVGVEFFRNLLPDKVLWFFKFAMRFLILGILAVAEYYFYLYIIRSKALTPAMQIPYRWIQASLLVGFAIILIHHLSFIFNDLNELFSRHLTVDRTRHVTLD